MKLFWKSLYLGLRRRWRTGFTRGFALAGVIWLFTEISMKSFAALDGLVSTYGTGYFSTVIALCVLTFFIHVYETRSVSFRVPTTDSWINIYYGDLLSTDTDWLVGVGEFFDSDLGHVVSRESLHGKLIETVWNSDGGRFRKAVDDALKGKPFEITERSIKPNKKYPIGTTAVLPRASRKIFLVAMARTDLQNAKASSTVPILWDALLGAFHSIHNFGNGGTVSLPLIGNGRSSVNIEPQHLLRLIVLSLIDFGRKTALPKQVNIVLPEECFERLDIREIRRDWSHR
ncbi:macro domain-containing protein [Afipia clevelandensis]|uniref:Thoeris protein ThsA Macro domain-containing protein n=1 Tax=Afipia clevelandensis ATCC 49720 TaxID=883079 RepID=K8PK79_9BRAD|nr:macro domain-containing protein [Afipia clevelandensis]EKS39930.1 hypothetical protein HMPREF9696_00942 [Afipia clevelandensis ATCC 49720]